MSEIERTTDWADIDQLASMLDLLRVMEHPAAIPFLFRCLAHAREEIRTQAKKIVRKFGWEKVAAFIEVLALHGDAEQFGAVLDGLAAFEAHREIVTLLDRLVTLLKGDQRNRTILLLERKQQSLDLERIADLFRESRQPIRDPESLGPGAVHRGLLGARRIHRARRRGPSTPPGAGQLAPDSGSVPGPLAAIDQACSSEPGPDPRGPCFSDRHIYYVVRDYVDGVTLQKLLESGRVFSPDQIIRILRQLLLALTPLHANGMVHGSIKPSNIFLCGEDRVILGDISLPLRGFSVQLDRLSYDYRYAPPEMFRQGGILGPWSDFYSLGCVAYELACGAPPFVSDNHYELSGLHVREAVLPPSQRGSSLGQAGDALLFRFLAKAPSNRVQNLGEAHQCVEDLHAALFPRATFDALPLVPLLGEESRLLYATDNVESEVSFPLTPRPRSSSAHGLRSSEDTHASGMPDSGAVSVEDTIDSDPQSSTEMAEHVRSQIGKYTIRRIVGRGGLGTVYLAWDAILSREVAIKVSATTSANGLKARARFVREAMAIARVSHPNIVRIHDSGEDDGSFYVVLEDTVSGGSLAQRLRDRVWPPREAARLVATLARAVGYAHSLGIVHRDLKPSNILFTEDGMPKLSDFGLAKVIGEQQEDAASTSEGVIVGTPSYMSPEQASGEIGRIGPATDIHALGEILYELLAGRRPFEGGTFHEKLIQVREYKPEPPSRFRPELPRDLDAICLRCLEKDPAGRYSSAAALSNDLELFLIGQPITARPRGAWDLLRRLFLFKKSKTPQDLPGR